MKIFSITILAIVLSICSAHAGNKILDVASLSKRLAYQIELNLNIYKKLKDEGDNEKLNESLLSSLDTSIMNLFEIIIDFDRESIEEETLIKIRSLYLKHMKETHGPGSIEGWYSIKEYLRIE